MWASLPALPIEVESLPRRMDKWITSQPERKWGRGNHVDQTDQ